MPRRFALALVTLLLLLFLALVVGRHFKSKPQGNPRTVPTPRPTPVVPPTPIPARGVVLYFESGADEKLHPEARQLAVARDEVAFLRSLASAVLEGPRRPELLRPFPEGWGLRGAYRMKDGLIVLDLSPPPAPQPNPAGGPPPRWETGSHEEETAAQAILLSVTKNMPDVKRVVFLIGGEPAETLAGHLDLSHPLRPDATRAVDEPPLEAPPAATPSPSPSPSPAVTSPASPEAPSPTVSPTPIRPRVPKGTESV
jgi:hypothetical protein